jgi:hypothetical protein
MHLEPSGSPKNLTKHKQTPVVPGNTRTALFGHLLRSIQAFGQLRLPTLCISHLPLTEASFYRDFSDENGQPTNVFLPNA